MCPICIMAATLSAAGATSGVGLIAVAANQLRTLMKRWFGRERTELAGRKRYPSM
jgi:hypothetical protein